MKVEHNKLTSNQEEIASLETEITRLRETIMENERIINEDINPKLTVLDQLREERRKMEVSIK